MINLTPHDITIQLPDGSRRVIKKSGFVARTLTKYTVLPSIDGIPVSTIEYGKSELPPLAREGYQLVESTCYGWGDSIFFWIACRPEDSVLARHGDHGIGYVQINGVGEDFELCDHPNLYEYARHPDYIVSSIFASAYRAQEEPGSIPVTLYTPDTATAIRDREGRIISVLGLVRV